MGVTLYISFFNVHRHPLTVLMICHGEHTIERREEKGRLKKERLPFERRLCSYIQIIKYKYYVLFYKMLIM